VGVTFRLADVARQTRVKRATVDRVGRANGKVVFVFPRNAHVADVDGGLNRTGPVNEINLSLFACRDRWILVRRHRAALPTGESLLDLRERFIDVDVADDDEMSSVGNVVLGNESAQVVSRQRTDRLLIRHDKAVRMISEDG